MKKKLMVFFMMCLLISLTACSKSDQNPIIIDTEGNIFDEGSNTKTEVLGAYNLRFRDIDTTIGIVAEQKNFDVPITIETMSYPTKVGILVILDGKPIKYSTNEDAEKTYIKNYNMQGDEVIDLTLNGEIMDGLKGDEQGLYIIGLLEPEFEPENENDISFGTYHKDLSLLPITVRLDCDISEKEDNNLAEVNMQPISKTEYEEYKQEDGSNTLDDNMKWFLNSGQQYQNKIVTNQGKVSLSLEGFGGDSAQYSAVMFINHEPVMLNEKTNNIITIEKGKKSLWDFEIDISNYKRINSLYFIIVPADEYYKNSNLNQYKTVSRPLINDMAEVIENNESSEKETSEKETSEKETSEKETEAGNIEQKIEMDIEALRNIVYSDLYDLKNNSLMFFNSSGDMQVYHIDTQALEQPKLVADKNMTARRVGYVDNGIVLYGIENAILGTEYACVYDNNLDSSQYNFRELLPDAQFDIMPIRLSRNEEQIAYISVDNKIKLYHIAEAKTDEIFPLGTEYSITEMQFSMDNDFIVVQGRKANDRGVGIVDIEKKDMQFVIDENVDNQMMVTQKGIFLDEGTAAKGADTTGNIYQITSSDYSLIPVADKTESQRANISPSGQWMVTQKAGEIRLYQVGEKEPVQTYKIGQFNLETTTSSNALILEERREIWITFTDNNQINTYCLSF